MTDITRSSVTHFLYSSGKDMTLRL